MTTLAIYLYADPNYITTVTLDGNQYQFTIKWSYSELAWYLDIKGITDPTAVLNGIKLVGGVDLLEPYGLLDLNQLWCIDLVEKNRDPEFDNIETDFILIYR